MATIVGRQVKYRGQPAVISEVARAPFRGRTVTALEVRLASGEVKFLSVQESEEILSEYIWPKAN